MDEPSQRLLALLDSHGIAYERVRHPRDYTAQETAAHTHTPGREFAKAVLLRLSDGHAMAVLPAHHRVDLERLGAALGGREVELASEPQIAELCPDCEVGALPPFGNLYGLPVYASPALASNERITCVAGSHADVIRLAWSDYERLVQPQIVDFSVPDAEHPPPQAPERG